MNKPIGLLDSGVGGLTVLKAVIDCLPNESIVYIGDTKRCPYGNRSKEEIIEYTLELVQFLMDQHVKMIVIACNTATAHTLEIVKNKVDIPVIGVIEPGSEAAVRLTKSKKVGVLATVSTVDSGFYEKSILGKDESIHVKSLACPEFVEIVEKNLYETVEAKKIVEKRLESFKTGNMDTVILGCTHFPLLTPFIQERLGIEVTLIDSGALTSYEVEKVLKEFKLDAKAPVTRTIDIYTTGPEKPFRTIAQNWLQTSELNVRAISLERLKLTHD
ncbi:glutamate racemase [Alkalibacterium sp. f15]|uniref:glutamate racemase n=1 Tax=Alkalibacterium sp. f15 TaxID=3414029 RepID=UPI003BF7C18B